MPSMSEILAVLGTPAPPPRPPNMDKDEAARIRRQTLDEVAENLLKSANEFEIVAQTRRKYMPPMGDLRRTREVVAVGTYSLMAQLLRGKANLFKGMK